MRTCEPFRRSTIVNYHIEMFDNFSERFCAKCILLLSCGDEIVVVARFKIQYYIRIIRCMRGGRNFEMNNENNSFTMDLVDF